MIRGRRSVVAAALLAAAATLLTGCGSGGEQDKGSGKARSAAASADDRAAGDSPATDVGEGSEAKKPKAPRTPPGPKVSERDLKPVTGSFTEKQKSYLTDRVPKGTDPAAVLQIGQESCDRLSRTAELDRKAAISALRSGEIPNAEAAVKHLCPKQLPLLKASKEGSGG
ncbi:hypothetical protein [Streptomyces sp. bgisy100]|uniref:hypothetical protein n=1 Tax=Streptomyces sp. bgisy100 TaxID=3413783 RepID=UPI003D708789